MKTILITRPQEEAEALASALATKGFGTFIEPLLQVETLRQNKAALEAALACRPQAILATSRRGVQALAELTAARNTPVYTVGEATGLYAQTLGLIASGHGETAEALCGLVAKKCDPSKALLYVRGKDISTDIAAELTPKGFRVDSVIVYRAVPVREFSTELGSTIAKGGITGVMFFSRRTASTYAGLVKKHALVKIHCSMSAACMSETIAEELRALPWKSIRTAAKPDMEHMLEAAGKVF